MKKLSILLSIFALVFAEDALEYTHVAHRDEAPSYNPMPEDEVLPNAAPVITGLDPYVQGELLYMFARQDGLPYTMTNEVAFDSNGVVALFPKRVERIARDWDFGFRVGIGATLPHDEWDVGTKWTYFQTDSSNKTKLSTPAPFGTDGSSQKNLAPLWAGGSVYDNEITFGRSTSARGSYGFRMNQLDGEVGKAFWVSTHINLRPFFGVRGMWTSTDFSAKYSFDRIDENDARVSSSYRVSYEQNFAGAGLLGGINSLWHFTKNFSVYADSAASLLLGEYEITSKQRYSAGSSSDIGYKNTTRDDIRSNQFIVDLGAGLTWESWFSDGDYHIRFDLGWEEHLWLNQNKLFQFDEFNGMFETKDGNLIISGLVLKARFDF